MGREKPPDPQTLGGRMKLAMKHAELKSQQMADRLMPSVGLKGSAAVRKWMLTNKVPSEALRPWAEITGVSLNWLMTGRGAMVEESFGYVRAEPEPPDVATPRHLAREWPRMTFAQQDLVRAALRVIREATPAPSSAHDLDVPAEEPGAGRPG